MKKGLFAMTESTRWYYRLGNQDGHEFLWSGAITVTDKISKAQARRAVAKRERVKRLPANTIVVSSRELSQRKWTEAKIRQATTKAARPTPVAVAPKAFEDVGPSMDEIQAMLKKLGLA